MQHRLLPILASLTVAAACGSNPVAYSAPVAINLKAKSSDTVGGVVTDEKGITTESGNPYGAFVAAATAELDGRAPSSIEVDRIDVLLGAGSVGVVSLGEIYAGNLDVLFQMNDTNNSYLAGTGAITATTGAGPIRLDIRFEGVPELDHVKMLGGGFKVIARGPAATAFETKGADADLQITFTFAAFE